MSLVPILPSSESMPGGLPSRRGFLLQAIAAGSGLLAGCGSVNSPAKPEHLDGWIDGHTHVWTDDTKRFPVGPWVKPAERVPRHFTAEEWLAVANPLGIRRAVLVQHSPYYGNDSSYLIDCCRRYPGVFSVIGRIDEHEPDLRGRVRLLKSQGIRGLRISPTIHGDRTPVADPPNWLKSVGMRTLWREAAEQSIIMCPILSPEFLPTLAPMCAEFSWVKCVIDHLGQVDLAKEGQIVDLLNLARHPNIYVKVSAFYKFGARRPPYLDLAPLIQRLVGAFGASRLLWGSDCPYQLQGGSSMKDSVDLIARRLDFLTASDRQAMLHDVAGQLFFDNQLSTAPMSTVPATMRGSA
jgi:predicted TIM-barrel fold metal-dependent hydrolase